jgi:hypothetical protein
MGISSVWPPWIGRSALLLGRWLTSLRFCCLWGGVLLSLTAAPCLADCLERRSEILDQGKPTSAWLFSNNVLKKTLVTSLVVNAVFGLVCLGCRRRRSLPLLTLIPLHCLTLASARSLEIGHQYRAERACGADTERQWQHLRRLEIVEGFSPTLYHFDAQTIPVDSIKSFDELHAWIANEYRQRQPNLKKELGVDDENRLKTVFFMHFLADLWSFGNKVATDKPGSVLANEENDWQPPPQISAQTFIQARIGCCADIAYVFKALLDREKIPNRLTAIPGHVFNEVELDGKWWIADGSTNILVECGWNELFQNAMRQTSSCVRVFVFPDPRIGSSAGADYRPLTAQFRIQMLLRMAAGPTAFQCASHPELPVFFQD